MTDVRAALMRQAELWRALLSGDKDARQMIDPDTVVAASVRHASRLGTLIRGLAGAYLPALGLAACATLLLVYAILFQNGIATVVGALGAVAATLIVLRRVVSLTVGNTIDELREDLWSVELDAAVAQSILRLPARAAAAPRPRPMLAPPPQETQTQKVQAGITKRVERALRGDPQRPRPGVSHAGLGSDGDGARRARGGTRRQRHARRLTRRSAGPPVRRSAGPPVRPPPATRRAPLIHRLAGRWTQPANTS